MDLRIARILSPVLIFVGVLAVIVSTEGNYGPHWDAPHYLTSTDRLATYLSYHLGKESLFPAPPPLSDLDHYFPRGDRHPPALKVLAGVTEFLFRDSMGTLASARLSVAVLAAGLAAVLFVFLRRPLGGWCAVAAVLLWISLPRVFAHAHFLALDQPVAFFYLLSMVAFYHLHQRWLGPPETGRSRRIVLPAIAATVALSLGLLTKHQSHFVIPTVLAWSGTEAYLARGGGRRRFLQWGLLVLSIGAAAGILFVAGWPALWHHTLTRLGEYAAFVLHHAQVPVIYFGHRYPPGTPAWHFPIVMWIITVPVLTLLLFVCGCLLRPAEEKRRLWRFLLFATAGPFFFLSLPGVPRFDGVRHLMPAAPFFAAVAALGLREGSKRLGQLAAIRSRTLNRQVWGQVFAAGGLLAAVLPVFTSHPFQHVYYNSVVGGLRGAATMGMEADYLGVSTKSLFPFLNSSLKDSDTLFVLGMNPQVFYPPMNRPWPGAESDDGVFARARVCSIDLARHLVAADGIPFLLANHRRSLDPTVWKTCVGSREPVAAVQWDGVTLCGVYRLDWETLPPTEPIYSRAPVVLLEVRQSEMRPQWEALWGCREKPRIDWGITWQWRNEQGEPLELGYETQLVPLCATRFWFPGDVYRAWYPRAGEIRSGFLHLAIWPHPQADPTAVELFPVPVTRDEVPPTVERGTPGPAQ